MENLGQILEEGRSKSFFTITTQGNILFCEVNMYEREDSVVWRIAVKRENLSAFFGALAFEGRKKRSAVSEGKKSKKSAVKS